MNDEKQPESTPSQITVTFEAPGHTAFEMQMTNVLPGQLAALADYLEALAKQGATEQVMAQVLARAKQQQAMAQVQGMLGRTQ